DADVRVVDVPVDDVGDDAAGMLLLADAVGERSEQRQRRVTIQLERLVGAHAPAAANLVSEIRDSRHRRTAAFRRRTPGRARRRSDRRWSSLRAPRVPGSTGYYRA